MAASTTEEYEFGLRERRKTFLYFIAPGSARWITQPYIPWITIIVVIIIII
jgi:hypothetical protein